MVFPLNLIQTLSPSQLLNNILDDLLETNHVCVCDLNDRSSSMESSGLFYLIKELCRKTKGEILYGTIVIYDDTCINKVLNYTYTLPRGQRNKEGIML